MKYFDISDQIGGYQKAIEGNNPEKMSAKLNQNQEEGIRQIAEMVTYLPEEKRETAVKAFIGAMLFE